MSNPDEAARVREIKSLLDRIQQMPHVIPPDMASSQHHQQWMPEDQYPAAGDYTPTRRPSTLSPWVFVLATALNTIVAAVLAVLITLGVVRQDPARSDDSVTAAHSTRTAIAGESRDARTSVYTANPAWLSRNLELASIGSPAEPLHFEPHKASRLPLRIQPEDAVQEAYILILSGLPAGASLTGGKRIGSDSWLLPPNSMLNLELTFTEWSATLIEVGVELRRIDGSIAARSKAWFAVPPPESAKPSAKPDPAALKDLLRNGDQLLARGDVVGARAIYERAALMGSAPAALALGSTYDPSRLWSLGVFGMVGNKERARQWYARADQLGHPSAKDRLRGLEE